MLTWLANHISNQPIAACQVWLYSCPMEGVRAPEARELEREPPPPRSSPCAGWAQWLTPKQLAPNHQAASLTDCKCSQRTGTCMTNYLSNFVQALNRMDNTAPDYVYGVFDEQLEDLVWFAAFLVAHRELTDVCLLDAVNIVVKNPRFSKNPGTWTRRAVIQSAIEMQQRRITTLGTIYQRRTCWHAEHTSIEPEVLKRLTTQCPEALIRLDTLCRFALALRNVENLSTAECAAILRVSHAAVENAYCAGIEILSEIASELAELEDECQEVDCT
jgi:DNA-directed RNA polymerase specialized sigma24 family protein